MVNAKSRGKTHRLANMDGTPKVEVYSPPPKARCLDWSMPVPLDDEGLLQYVWAQQVYRGKVVHFSVETQIRDHVLADWQPMYRIDTAHGTVHEHHFSRRDEESTRTVLAEIPLKDSWEFVDGWFVKALDMCDTNWNAHLERWR